MDQSKISNNLLFTQQHFDLLARLYTSSFRDFHSVNDLYQVITETMAQGLHIDRASYCKIDREKLVCLNLYDHLHQQHTTEKDLLAIELPNYFNALRNGIAIVADDALTNEFTRELKQQYLLPRGITDMLDLPVRENGRLVGVFDIDSPLLDRFSDEDKAGLDAMVAAFMDATDC